jgi:hypothetical protein
MTEQDDQVTFTREGVWRDNKPFEITVRGPKELPDELNEFLTTSAGGALLLVPKKTMQRLLNDDAHWDQQRKHLQQRGTELLEQLRIYRRLALTDSQKEFVEAEMKALRERLLQSYGETSVGMDRQE